MIESKANRVSKLEQRQTATDLKKDYCSCDCHRKTIFDYWEIPDEKIIRFAEIMHEQMGEAYCKELQQRIADKKPCNCKH